MELWIRSQDKKRLYKANGLDVHQNGKNLFEWNVEDTLMNGLLFGTYSTEERALEVLGEIQKKIEETFWDYSKDDYCVKSITNIYQMPKE